MSRFQKYLDEAKIPLRNFDATDPEHVKSFKEWQPWNLKEADAGIARHLEALDLAIDCISVVHNTPLPALPLQFVERIADEMNAHDARRHERPGMAEAYLLAVDFLCAALLGWPLEEPLNRDVTPEILRPWQAAARNLVLQRVDASCERCRRHLERRVIGFKEICLQKQINWVEITERIVNRLIEKRLWLAWQRSAGKGKEFDNLKGNAKAQHHTRLMQHFVGMWLPDELLNKRQADGETFSFFGYIDRAVQGFCTKYNQKYRAKFVGNQFKASLLPSGMLFPFLERHLELILGAVFVWKSDCPECGGWKTAKCSSPKCTFERKGRMDIKRGFLLLEGPFRRRQAWQCRIEACLAHGFFFFSGKCESHCKKEINHDECPSCKNPHSKGRSNRTITAYEYEPRIASRASLRPRGGAQLGMAQQNLEQPSEPQEEELEPDVKIESGASDLSDEPNDPSIEIGTSDQSGMMSADAAVEDAATIAFERYQHHEPWVQSTIVVCAEIALAPPAKAACTGYFPWLKALLPKGEVDWTGFYQRVTDETRRRDSAFNMGEKELLEMYHRDIREPIYEIFECHLSNLDYDLVQLALDGTTPNFE